MMTNEGTEKFMDELEKILEKILDNQARILRNQGKLAFMLDSLDFVGGPMKEIKMEEYE